MHTFFIDTTGRQCFRDYQMLYHKYLANNDLIILEQPFNEISGCIGNIQELINKDPDIRDDFGILVSVDLDAEDQNFRSVEEQQAWVAFFIQEKLIEGLKAIAFNPKKFAPIFIISQCRQDSISFDYQKTLKNMLPWRSFDDESFNALDERVRNIIQNWDDRSSQQTKIDAKPLMRSIIRSIQEGLPSMELNDCNDIQLQEYYSGLFGHELNDYYGILPEKGASFVLPIGNDEERNCVLFSCAAYVRQCVEEQNYTCFKTCVRFDLELLSALEEHKYCLEKIKEDLVYQDEQFLLYNEIESNEKLLNKTQQPKFEEISSTLPPKSWFSLLMCSPKKLKVMTENYIQAVKSDISKNKRALETWSEEISVEFQAYQNKFNHRSELYPRELFSEQGREKTVSGIRRYKEEIRESIVSERIELSRQTVASYKDESIDTAVRAVEQKSEVHFKRLNHSLLFSGIMSIVCFLIVFVLPYLLVSPKDRVLGRSLLVVLLYSLIFMVVFFVTTAVVSNHHKKIISRALCDFSAIGESAINELQQMYTDLSKRFNVILPDLIRRQLYLQWLNEEEEKLISTEEKTAVHRQKIEDDFNLCERLEKHFDKKLFDELSVDVSQIRVPELDQNGNFDRNDEVYMILADKKIGQYCSEV